MVVQATKKALVDLHLAWTLMHALKLFQFGQLKLMWQRQVTLMISLTKMTKSHEMKEIFHFIMSDVME